MQTRVHGLTSSLTPGQKLFFSSRYSFSWAYLGGFSFEYRSCWYSSFCLQKRQ